MGAINLRLPLPLTEEQYDIISSQQSKSLCQIITDDGNANGFLCEIPYPVLVTSYDVISKIDIEQKKEIIICFTGDNKK